MIRRNIGENIRQYRQMCHISQKELAERLNVSDRTISSWEVNRTEPNVEMVERMSLIFGCLKSELIGEAEKSSSEQAIEDALLLKKIKRLSPRDRAIIEHTVDTMLGES